MSTYLFFSFVPVAVNHHQTRSESISVTQDEDQAALLQYFSARNGPGIRYRRMAWQQWRRSALVRRRHWRHLRPPYERDRRRDASDAPSAADP